MSKKSHNKKRNVGIIYNLLLKTAAAGLVEGNNIKTKKAQEIMKRFFHSENELYKEYKLFAALSENFGFDSNLATRVLSEGKNAAKRHSKHKLEREKDKCIKEINHTFGNDFWSQNLANYTSLATVGQLLESWRNGEDFEQTVVFESKVHSILTEKPIVKTIKEEKIPEVDNLVVKIMLEKFNEKYGKTMTPVQQNLIKAYIFSDSEPEKFTKLIESVQKNALQKLKDYKTVCDNKIVLSKIDQVYTQIKEVKVRNISDDNLAKFLKIVDLTEEIGRN